MSTKSYTLADNSNVTVNTTANGVEFNEGMGALTKAIKAKITASSGGASSSKLEPTLLLPSLSWQYDQTKKHNYFTYEYDGDGIVLAWSDSGPYSQGNDYIHDLTEVHKGTAVEVDQINKRIYGYTSSVSWGMYIYATETENYQAKGIYVEDSE